MSMEQIYYARIKPVNPKRRHFRVRMHCLGRLWQGGDGIQEIPKWYRVNRAQAEALAQFKQDRNDAYSEPVFDILTEADKNKIDLAETEFRMSVRGLAARTITEMPKVQSQVEDLLGGSKPKTIDELAKVSSANASPFKSSVGSIEGIDAPVNKISPPKAEVIDVASTAPGREAALEGFTDGEDLTEGLDEEASETMSSPKRRRAKKSS